ncbi:MAG: hypothetical protein ABIQ47_02020 [Tepidiformaceae bacterium]
MPLRGQLRPLALSAFAAITILAGAFVLSACSNNGDKPADSATGTAPAETTGTAGSTSGGSASANDADKTYAKQLCTSLNSYLDTFLQEASKDSSLLTDETKLLKIAGPAISGLGNDLQKVTPPADVKEYHDQLVAKAKEVSQKVQSGQISSIADIANVTTGVKAPPKAIRDRLQAAANDTKECQQNLFAGSLFGG